MTEKEFTTLQDYEKLKIAYDILREIDRRHIDIPDKEYAEFMIKLQTWRDAALNAIKIQPSQKSLKEKIEEIGANFHEPDIIAQTTTTVQMFREDNAPFVPLSCPCCVKNTVTLTTIHHDSGDHKKDISICTDCYIKVHSWWTQNTIGKLLPGSR